MPPKKRNAVSPRGNSPKRAATAYHLRSTGPAPAIPLPSSSRVPQAAPTTPTRPASPNEVEGDISEIFDLLGATIFNQYLPPDASSLVPKFHASAARLAVAMDAVRDALEELDIVPKGVLNSAVQAWKTTGGSIPSNLTTSSTLPIPVYGPLLPPDWTESKFVRRQPVRHTGTQSDVRSYADVAAQTISTSTSTSAACTTSSIPAKSTTHAVPTKPTKPTTRASPTSTRALVVHGVSVKHALGKTREGLERENSKMGRIIGIRWLLKMDRRVGKTTSSVVVYLERPGWAKHLWLGRRRLRAEGYDFDRRVKEDETMGG